MFNCCPFTSINLTSFNTQSVTKMDAMLRNCSNLISLDLWNFDTEIWNI